MVAATVSATQLSLSSPSERTMTSPADLATVEGLATVVGKFTEAELRCCCKIACACCWRAGGRETEKREERRAAEEGDVLEESGARTTEGVEEPVMGMARGGVDDLGTGVGTGVEAG